GHLKSMTNAAGVTFSYEFLADSEAPYSKLKPENNSSEAVPSVIYYDKGNTSIIKSILMTDDTTLNYENGFLRGIIGLEEKISIEDINKVILNDDEYTKIYDEKGTLEKVVTSGQTEIYFDGDEISEVVSEDSSRVLYTGGRISELYDKKEGIKYTTDETGRPIKAVYDNGKVADYTYETLSDGRIKVTITTVESGSAESSVTVRLYENDLLVWQKTSLGVESVYEYETIPGSQTEEKRIKKITQTKSGVEIGRYVYDYQTDRTTVTDINEDRREYDLDGSIRSLYTHEGYVYSYTVTEYGSLVKEMIMYQKKDGSGRVIYYENGEITKVESPDGTVIKNPVFDSAGTLKSFTVILPSGESRDSTIYEDGWSDIVTPDGTKLIYKGNVLIAVNSNHKLFMFQKTEKIPSGITIDITEDASALDHIAFEEGELTEITRIKLLDDYGILGTIKPLDYSTIPGSKPWCVQEHASTRGIESLSIEGDTMTLQADMHPQTDPEDDNCYTQGEVYYDLAEYNQWGAFKCGEFDLTNKRLSFYVKLEADSLPQGKGVILQAFAKMNDGLSEYSTQITITEDGIWQKVVLDISTEKPLFGVMDPNFDPTKVRLLGIRLKDPTTNLVYNGKVYVKDANYSTLAENEDFIDMPFFIDKASVKPYVGAIPDDQPVQGDPNYFSWADVEEFVVDSGFNQIDAETRKIYLDKGTWRAQDIAFSRGLEKLERDDVNNQWNVNLDLTSGSYANNDGEMFVDLRYDLPNHEWTGPLDLTGKEITFRVKVPEDFPLTSASGDGKPSVWAQLFVKDENYNYQYGKSFNITKSGEWIIISLKPQFGEIEEKNSKTSPDFDPTKIVHIGIKFSCNEGVPVKYKGQISVQNGTDPDIFNQYTPVTLIDINALSCYAAKNNVVLTFEEFLGPQIQLARESLPTYFKDDTFDMATEYYPSGAVMSILKGSERVEHYDTNGKLTSITDKNYKTLVKYEYDENGDMVNIDYSGLREDTRSSMESARVQAKQKAAETVNELGRSKKYAEDYVTDIIQPELDSLNARRSSYKRAWSEWNDKEYDWWEWGRNEEKCAYMHAYENAIGQIDGMILALREKERALYTELDAEIAKTTADVNAELEKTLTGINEK
ncbi:MAG: hypothetical protein PHW46_05785, partial [Candidatus Omnitrophica bacterium]|nr:hypothetical protein [Candidatus Omnitrophota bacterium]